VKVSLIITTYNWKEALKTVLNSVLNQVVMPNEVIIADDGSNHETAELIKQMQVNFPVPLIHSWQNDDGFRAARSRNRALAKAKHEYLIIIDGDIVLCPEFIADHVREAKFGRFIQGGRVLLGKVLSQEVMEVNRLPTIFSKGVRNRQNMINCLILSKIFSSERNDANSTRSCNMSFWKEDVIKINGFNEEFVGWGREDSEFVHRLLNIGTRRYYLKFAANGYHLYHQENTRNCLSANNEILNATIQKKLSWCEHGIDTHVENEMK